MSPLPIKYFDPMAIRKGFLGNSKSPLKSWRICQSFIMLIYILKLFTICLSSMFPSQHIPSFISTHLFFVIHETPCLSYRGFQPPKRSCPPRWCLLPPSTMAEIPKSEIPGMSSRPGLLGLLDARPTRPCQPTERRFLAPFGSEVFSCASVSGWQMLPGSVVPDSWRSPRLETIKWADLDCQGLQANEALSLLHMQAKAVKIFYLNKGRH